MDNRAKVIEITAVNLLFDHYLIIPHDTQNTLAATYLIDFLSMHDYLPVRIKKAGSFLHVYFLIGTKASAGDKAAEFINYRLIEIDQYLEDQAKRLEKDLWKVTAMVINENTGGSRPISCRILADTEKEAINEAMKDFSILHTERIDYAKAEKINYKINQ